MLEQLGVGLGSLNLGKFGDFGCFGNTAVASVVVGLGLKVDGGWLLGLFNEVVLLGFRCTKE